MKEFTIIIVIVAGIWYFWPSEKWSGYFYPNKDDLSNYTSTGIFDSLEKCRDTTVAYGEDRGIPYNQFDYECGLNCKNNQGLNVCKETLK